MLLLRQTTFILTNPIHISEAPSYPPHPLPLPGGEREGVRGNFKYFWLNSYILKA